jgi:hypothetical protein
MKLIHPKKLERFVEKAAHEMYGNWHKHNKMHSATDLLCRHVRREVSEPLSISCLNFKWAVKENIVSDMYVQEFYW